MKLSLLKSKNFRKFLKELFDALDEDNNKVLTPDEFIIPLLSYGVTTDPAYIEQALLVIFKAKSLSSIKIERDKFVDLFKDDSRNDTILEALQYHTNLLVSYEENVKIARKKTMVNRSETRIEDAVPRIYCTIEDFIRMIKI